MRNNKWVIYLILILIGVSVFFNSMSIKKHNKYLGITAKTIENIVSALEDNLKSLSTINDIQIILSEDIKKLRKTNTSMLEDYIVPELGAIFYLIKELRINQKTVVDFLKTNVDPKPAFKILALATVEVKVGRAGGAGTIIKIDEEYVYVLTAKHIVNGKGKVQVQMMDTKTRKYVRVSSINKKNIFKDTEVDMAVIKVPKPEGDFIYLKLAEYTPTVGTRVYTVGHPISLGYTINTGIVSNYTKRMFGKNKKTYMTISAPAIWGNSGGGCMDSYNKIIGIVVGIAYVENEQIFSKTYIYLTHLVFVVTIEDVHRFMKELKI